MYISTSLLCIQFHIDLANKRQQNKCYFYTIICMFFMTLDMYDLFDHEKIYCVENCKGNAFKI